MTRAQVQAMREANAYNSDGLALCKGLSRANAEYLRDVLQTRLGGHPQPVVQTFLRNLDHALAATPDYTG
jgi:hypothetical protein